MKTNSIKTLLITLFLLCSICLGITPEFVPGQIVYKIKKDSRMHNHILSLQTIDEQESSASIPEHFPYHIHEHRVLFPANRNPLNTLDSDSKLEGIYRMTLEPSENIDEAISWLRQQPDIEYAIKDNIAHTMETIPNDPNYASDQKPYYDLYYMEDAWSICTGSSTITVAVIDTGIQTNHPDLIDNLVAGYNFVSSTTNTDDDYGHGTHVAGIIGARGNNGLGVTGMAWNCKLLPVKCLDSTGHGDFSELAQGIIYAVNHGARVINMSLGGDYMADGPLAEAITYAANNNVVIVAAAGNDNVNLDNNMVSPVCNDENTNQVIGVSSLDYNCFENGVQYYDYHKSSFSNYAPDHYVDVSAIGRYVYSTYPGSNYRYDDGTSMATPMVSGLAALILSRRPTLTPTQVLAIMQTSATPVNTYNPNYNGMLGAGLINTLGCFNLMDNPGSTTANMMINKFYNYPNPTSASFGTNASSTIFYFSLTAIPTSLKITLYTMRGEKLNTFAQSSFYASSFPINIELCDSANNALPPGIYIAVLEVTDATNTPHRAYQKVVIK